MNDMRQPLVSIVTPSYNQAKYLEQTIVSVLGQTYPNIDYIIIDGKSTDGSIELIERYKDKLTFWVSEPDDGQTDAVNKGLKHCKGELFAFLNSDDILEPDAVENAVNAYLQNSTHAVYYGHCSIIDEKGTIIKTAHGGEISHAHLVNKSMLPLIYQPACFFNTTIDLRQPLFREKNMIDYELLLWLSKRYSFVYLPLPFARYRIHAQSRTKLESLTIYRDKLRIQLLYVAGLSVYWRMLKLKIKAMLGIVKFPHVSK